jgi:transcriptional regulator with XRE-family HTH domain
MRCPLCRRNGAEEIGGAYRYLGCGLDYVYLVGIPHCKCSVCGEVVQIPREQELLELIARSVVTSPRRLGRQEIRFLRGIAGWTQAELAARTMTTRESVARWETGSALDPRSDILVRFAWVAALVEDLQGRSHAAHLARTAEEAGRMQAAIAELMRQVPAPGKPRAIRVDVPKMRLLDEKAAA